MGPGCLRAALRRRDLIALAAGAAAAPSAVRAAAPQSPALPAQGPFSASLVRDLARHLAQSPFQPPSGKLPPSVASIDYDEYRSIRFKTSMALWVNDKECFFKVEFFHLGFLYKDPVQIYAVVMPGLGGQFPR